MRIIPQILLSGLLQASLILLPVAGWADARDPLFASEDLLQLTFTGPFAQMGRERIRDKEYEGRLSYRDETGGDITLDVKFEVRGNSRLRESVCRYPPLWLNVRTGQATETVFQNQDKIKLVVRCGIQNRFTGYLVREYQAYRFYNQLSDTGFAVRMAEITYRDPANPRRDRTHLAFFLEHQERLAQRLGLKEVEVNQIMPAQLDQQQASDVAMFMYMISNTDFSLIVGEEGEECCHNSKLLQTADGRYLPVPYDFDSSGYVDASYAIPAAALRQRDVRQRIYRGFCVSNEIMDNTIALFNQQRSAFEAIMNDTAFISAAQAENSLEFVDAFYEIINDPERLESEIINGCR